MAEFGARARRAARRHRAEPNTTRGSGSLHGDRAWRHAVGACLWRYRRLRQHHGSATRAHGGSAFSQIVNTNDLGYLAARATEFASFLRPPIYQLVGTL